MNSRQEELLKHIISDHIETAEPVSSNFLLSKHDLDVSSATVRNDMAELEREGFIYQPYTSAGRVPTEKGFQYYLENYLPKDVDLSAKDKKEIELSIKSISSNKSNKVDYSKSLAKILAENTRSMVIIGFGKHDLYYTGISNLFSQPEFAELNRIYSISEVVDKCDEIVSEMFDKINETEIKVGSENLFSDMCASIFTNKDDKLFGILGPMRMDYEKNLGLINHIKILI